MPYLNLIDPDGLSSKKLKMNSVVDIDKGMELKHDFQKFYSFIESVIPKSEYLVNNYEGEMDEAEEKVMKRAGGIFWEDMNKNRKISEDSIILKETLTSEIGDLHDHVDLKLESELDLFGKEKADILNDLADLDEDPEENENEKEIFRRLYEKGIHEYKVYPKSTVLGNVITSHTKKINAANDTVVFHQEGFEHSPKSKSNWVYVLGLPYDIERYGEEDLKENIFRAIHHVGNVRNIIVTSFKSFLNEGNNNMLIPKNVESYFEDQSLRKIKIDMDQTEVFQEISFGVSEAEPETLKEILRKREEERQKKDELEDLAKSVGVKAKGRK